jgi:DNA-binding transcriptional LysR family regulator
MELRHLRYFVAVGEVLNFTKAAARLRVAQPALSRQVQDLEDEIGVDLLTRSTRGVQLTAEGKLFLEEARALLGNADDAVEKVRALARGEYGTLHVGYAPTPTMDLLPAALASFRAAVPRVTVNLHDFDGSEISAGLRNGTIEIAVTVRPHDENATGLIFDPLLRLPLAVACAPKHPLARSKAVTIQQALEHPFIAFRRDEYSDYYHTLDSVFDGQKKVPRIVAECDSMSSLITEVEGGRGIAILLKATERIIGPRLKLLPLADSKVSVEVGICRAVKGDVPPAGEKLCDHLRMAAKKMAASVSASKKERVRD